MNLFKKNNLLALAGIIILISTIIFSCDVNYAYADYKTGKYEASTCVKFDDCGGSGEYPYNFRVIDEKLFAGGNLFGPLAKKKNSTEKVDEYIEFLNSLGVKSIIALNVPAGNTAELDYIGKKCEEKGMKLYRFRMTSEEVPNSEQTKKIMELIENKAYVHCNWGCDRTGTIIAKYLILKKGYSGEKALRAVINGGSHSGRLGGFKQMPQYRKLLLYFWPDAVSEKSEVAKKFF